MKVPARDMRAWMVKDPYWTPGYVPRAEEKTPARMPLEALGNLLDAAAFGGDSAFVGVCFDLEQPDH